MNGKTLSKMKFILDYKAGLTDEELADKYGINDRTVRRRLNKYRKEGLIKYRKDETFTTTAEDIEGIMDVPESPDTGIVTREELFKLFALYQNRKTVADKLGISTRRLKTICDQYDIIDEEEKVKEIRDILDTTLDARRRSCSTRDTIAAPGEHFCVLFSDWHAGKKIMERGDVIYDIDVFKYRVDKILDSALALLDRHIKMKTDVKCVDLFGLGDLCDGSGEIYSSQVYNLESSFPQQIILVYSTIVNFIEELIRHGYKVNFYGVPGNHGRIGANPENNLDTLVYMLIEDWKIRNDVEDCTVNYSSTDYMDVEINGFNLHLRHKAYSQNKTSAGRAKYLGWAKIHDHADIILSGHFHTPYVSPENGITSVINGCLTGVDDFADRLALASEPTQVCFGLPVNRPMSFFYGVDLR